MNVMGVVVDHLAPVKSAGTDFVITFTLHDPSWTGGLGVKFRFFDKVVGKLPAIKTNGDVLLLRNIKIMPMGRSREIIGVSNYTTTWAVFPEESIPSTADDLPFEKVKVEKSSSELCLGRAETTYAIFLCNCNDRTSFAPPAPATMLEVAAIVDAAGGVTPARKEKFSLVRDLILPSASKLVFVDLLGEVRKCYANDFRVELSITDYTGHKALYNYAYGCDDEGAEGDRYGYMSNMQEQWPGPWGKMTITVALWDNHARFAQREVNKGDFVFLRNVQIAMDRDGQRMEGNIRGDKNYPEKVNISKKKPRDAENDPRMKDLLMRKREYEAKAKRENKQFIRDASNMLKKRTAFEAEGLEAGTGKKARKERKKNRKGAQMTEQTPAPALAEVTKPDSNIHVRCEKVEIPVKSIDDILDCEILRRKSPGGNEFYLPFQNCCYHSKVRVVDFLPDDIRHFAAPYRQSDYDVLSDDEGSDGSDIDMTPNENLKWQWRFCLLVEDATSPAVAGKPKAQMPLIVADTDGEYLMNMDASDLSKDSQMLEVVREKLFVLWGDLQERKEAAKKGDAAMDMQPKAKPFECLIKEYGVPVRDEDGKAKDDLSFDRMFRIFKTTIK